MGTRIALNPSIDGARWRSRAPVKVLLLTAIALVAVLALAGVASAKDTNWTGSSSGSWNNAANWSNGIPQSGDNVLLDTANLTGSAVQATTYDVTSLFATLNITFTGTGWSVAAGSYGTPTAGTFTVNSGADATWAPAWAVSANKTVTNGGTLTLSGSVVCSSGRFLTITGAGTTTISGVVSGAGGLTKSLNGTLYLTGNNTYTGATTINAGTFDASGTWARNSTVSISAIGGATTISGVISGTGGVTKSGNANVTLSGANTYSGATSVTGGTLNVTGNRTSGGSTSVSAGATLNVTGSWDNNTSTLTINSTGTTNISGVISNTGGLTKSGTGTLTLSGNNTYSGATTVNAGTLWSTKTGSLPGWDDGIPAITVAAEATLAVEASSVWPDTAIDSLRGVVTWDDTSYLGLDTSNASGEVFTYASDIDNVGMGITKLGSGTLILSGTNTYTGKTTVSAGTLETASPASLPGYDDYDPVIYVATTATLSLDVGGGTDWLEADVDLLCTQMAVSGWQNSNAYLGINTTNGPFDYTSGGIYGAMGLSKIGANALTISSNAISYTGKTKVTGGTLRCGMDNALPTTTDVLMSNVAGAVLDVGDYVQTIAVLSGGGTTGGDVDLGDDGTGKLTSTYDTGQYSFDGIISGAGAFEKGGVPAAINHSWLTLTGNNTFTGMTTISGGKLRINDEVRLGANPGSSDADHLLFESGGILEAIGTFTMDDSNRGITMGTGGGVMDVDSGFTLTVADKITGTGGLTKTDHGTLVLSGANADATAFTGSTTVEGGILEIDSAARLGGDITGVDADHLQLNAAATYTATLHVTGNVNITDADRGLTIGDGGGTINVDSGYKMTQTGNATGAGALTKSGSGELLIAGATGDYSGSCAVTAGTLRLNGTFGASSSVNVSSGATLAGTGDSNGTADIFGTLDPGSAAGVVGKLTTGSTTLEADMEYPVQMTDAQGELGVGYDLYDVTGDLSFGATSADPVLVTLTGTPTNYSSTGVYRWPIIRYSGAMDTWNAALFSLDYSGFTPPGGLGGRVPAIEYNATTKTIDIVLARDPTNVTVTSFKAYLSRGHVVTSWKTASLGTSVGFNVYRKNLRTGKWFRVNGTMIPAKLSKPAGATYRLADRRAPTDRRLTYKVKEICSDGSVNTYGPFKVRPSAARSTFQ